MKEAYQGNVVPLPQLAEKAKKLRKTGINQNKEGSIRRINDQVYVDFIYLDERVRESSGLKWTNENAAKVRKQLDRIMIAIESKTFRFHEAFPHSPRRDFFLKQEMLQYGLKKKSEEVQFGPAAIAWFKLHKESQSVTGRTLYGYKSHLDRYLLPFFSEMTFAQLNRVVFKEFVAFARELKLRKKSVSNETINKLFIPFKMICDYASVKYGWGESFNPFFKWSKLPEGDPIEKIFPFSLSEQETLRKAFSDHWRPFVDFAFRSGLRSGEQMGVKPDDIEWDKELLHIRRGITVDEEGKRIEGKTKNVYSRRTIKLTAVMLETLREQKEIYDQLKGEYFFCTPTGGPIYPTNLRSRVWLPALKEAGIAFREMKQTRHSFATNALSLGENPLWIAKVMGHRDAEMIIKVYSRFVENARGTKDGENLTQAYRDAAEDHENE